MTKVSRALLLTACGWAATWCEGTTFGLPGKNVLSNIVPSGGSRILAVDEKETKNMEVSVPLSQAATVDDLTESTLMRDIQMLSDILGEVVERENPQVHDLYRQMRQLGLER